MIGINPLIDAVLLQSLKGVSAPPVERGAPPVGLAESGQGTREVQSDSKLNDKPYHQPVIHNGYGPAKAYSAGTSTVITLNETAKLIADIMVKFPTVDTRLLILPLQQSQVGKSGVLSSQLQRLISFSGLFYESHLAAWFKGEYPESLLRLEPQYSFFRGADQRSQVFIDPPALSLKGPEERMQYMIRHQLEVLDSPNFHFAGNLVPGLPVQLWLQHVVLPTVLDENGKQVKSGSKKGSGWRILVRLEHETFDYVDFAIALVDDDLSVRITGNHAMLQEYFRRDFTELSSVFSNLGIEQTHFTRQLMSRLEVRPDFKLNITSGSHMPMSKTGSQLEQEYGFQAEHIFHKATKSGLTSHKSHELLGLLMNLQTDREIPTKLYSIIEILTFWLMSQIEYLTD